ncbi:hypothetical protein BJV82DRAFT_713403 [Fennellomyces sp. T-0311]|nr:hypothetical protein BJV82DRAFT_713403 [Fennellomyces sp. T-0311]
MLTVLNFLLQLFNGFKIMLTTTWTGKIQEHLRLTEEQHQALEDGTGLLPEALRLINWFLDLNEQGYQTLHHVVDSTFVTSWISPCQTKLLQESNETCIGAKRKSRKSIINCRDDAYLFSIVAKDLLLVAGIHLRP